MNIKYISPKFKKYWSSYFLKPNLEHVWAMLFSITCIYFAIVTTLGYFANYRILEKFAIPLVFVIILFSIRQLIEFGKEMKSFSRPNLLLLGLTVLLLTYLLKIVLFFPDYSWDGQAYHLPTSVEFFQSKKIQLVYLSLYSSTYPGLSELIQAIWFGATGIFGPPQNISQLLGLIIITSSANGIMKVFNFSKTARIKSIFFVLTIPNLMLQATSAYNDLFFNSLIISSIYFWLKYQATNGRLKLIYLMSFGFSVGAVSSVKFTGLYFTIALFTIFHFSNAVRRNFRFSHFLATIFFSLSISWIWYYRNWINFHNPTYPLSVEFLGFKFFDSALGTPNQAFFDHFAGQIGVQNNWIGVIRSFFWWPIKYPVYDTRIGGSGIAWLIIIILILFFLLSKLFIFREHFRSKLNLNSILKSNYLIIILFAIVSVFVVPAGWWPRYVLFFPVIIGIFSINELLKLQFGFDKILSLLLVLTLFESVFYMSFLAGKGMKDPAFNKGQVLTRSIESIAATLKNTERFSVYEISARDLKPISSDNLTVYISKYDYRYFPLYGINMQNRVFHAFDESVSPIDMPPLYPGISKNMHQLAERMSLDSGKSAFISKDLDEFQSLMKLNIACKNHTALESNTYIAICP